MILWLWAWSSKASPGSRHLLCWSTIQIMSYPPHLPLKVSSGSLDLRLKVSSNYRTLRFKVFYGSLCLQQDSKWLLNLLFIYAVSGKRFNVSKYRRYIYIVSDKWFYLSRCLCTIVLVSAIFSGKRWMSLHLRRFVLGKRVISLNVSASLESSLGRRLYHWNATKFVSSYVSASASALEKKRLIIENLFIGAGTATYLNMRLKSLNCAQWNPISSSLLTWKWSSSLYQTLHPRIGIYVSGSWWIFLELLSAIRPSWNLFISSIYVSRKRFPSL